VEAMRGENQETVGFIKALQGKPTETAFAMVIADVKKLKDEGASIGDQQHLL
jgi:hypothetical protein